MNEDNADSVAEPDDLARLEAALDRIARHARPPAKPQTDAADTTTEAIAGRLDALIAELRGVLGHTHTAIED